MHWQQWILMDTYWWELSFINLDLVADRDFFHYFRNAENTIKLQLH